MKYTTFITAALCAYTASAQTSTLTVVPLCATPAPDVMVTRSAVEVPSCSEASNATVIMASGASMTSGGAGGAMGSATSSGMPAEYTGAAAKSVVGWGLLGALAVGGLVV